MSGNRTSRVNNSKNTALEDVKIAQMSATFSVTIFLSLTLLLTKQIPEYDLLSKLLWTASGFFGAASIRLLDMLYDHNKDYKVILSLLQIRGHSFISLDERWLNGRFTFYFFGWLFFLFAFFFIGILIFTNQNPQSFLECLSSIASNYWLLSIFAVLVIVTLLSITREFFFIN